MALLALFAASAMADCATEGHYCDCQTPDVCHVCGATGVTGEITHSFANEIVFETDANRHFVYCEAGCGELLIDEERYVSCDDGGTACSVCGEQTSTIRHDFSEVGFDAENHWGVCADCGATDEPCTHDYDYCWNTDGICNSCGGATTNVMHTNMQFVSKVPGNCITGAVNTYKCGDCGGEEEYIDPCTGECYYTQQFDATGQWVACTGCGDVMQEKTDHMNDCSNPDHCRFCAYDGLTGEVEHWFIEQGYDATQHWYICEDCGEKGKYGEHYLRCDDPAGVCEFCGYACEPTAHADVTGTWKTYATCVQKGLMENVCICGKQWTEEMPVNPDFHNMEEIAITYPNCKDAGTQTFECVDCGAQEVTEFGEAGECSYEVVNAGSTHKGVCTGCGTVEWEEPHNVSCADGSTCITCGATGVTGEEGHMTGEPVYTANTHWWVCEDCGEKLWEGEHHTTCDGNTTVCEICCATGVDIVIYHYIGDEDLETSATEHWWNCPTCGEQTYRGAHEDLEGTGICYCGQPVPSAEHECTGEAVTVTAATCTEDGLEQTVCTTCGEVLSTKTLYRTGHYWVVTKTVDATAEKEGRIEYACRDCDATSLKRLPATGAAEETPAEETAEETVEETAEVAVKAVENVTVEAAEGEALSSDVALIVSEPEEDVSATLPEEIKENVAKVYFVKLTEKGEEITPAGSLKIAIQLEEGADLTGKKLMLVKEDGTLVEIEYEIVEGKLVFVTDAIGTFVLVDAPAE